MKYETTIPSEFQEFLLNIKTTDFITAKKKFTDQNNIRIER